MAQQEGPSASRFLAISEVEFIVLQQLVAEVPVKVGYLSNKILMEGVAARPMEGFTTEVPSVVQNQAEQEAAKAVEMTAEAPTESVEETH